jgi:hypothetical protein
LPKLFDVQAHLLVVGAHAAEADADRGGRRHALAALCLHLQQLLHRLVDRHEARRLVDLASAQQVLDALLLDLDV